MLIIYDFMLTTPDEVELIWSRKLGAGSVIHIMSRISAIIYVLSSVLDGIDNVRRSIKDGRHDRLTSV